MASALASQLQDLARQRQPALPATLKGKGKPSLLFDFQKAADVDLHTIYGIACQGLEELVRVELRFRPFRESLFSRASLDINPELQTADFLAKLDDSITNFCHLLSNHFLAPAAFKALEYLVRRYKANERNVDALLTAALPYHATNEFVRLVQTLAIGAPGSLWGWLAKMQSSGASLPRDLLAQRCANDRQLLVFVCKAAGQLGGASDSGLRAHSRTFLSFYAVLLCEVLAVLPSIGEEMLALLLPHLLGGLGRGAAQDYRAATLMAVAELCSRATLGRDFIKVLLNTMLKHTEPTAEHVRTALLVMAHVAVTQPHVKTLSDKTLKHLSELPNAVQELASLSQRGNMRLAPLLLLLARSLAAALVASGGGAGGSAGRRCEADLLALAHSGALRGEPAGALAGALLAAGGAAKADAGARASCQKLLRVLDQRYPETTDAAVNAYLEPLRNHRRQAAAASTTAAVTATATITPPADAPGAAADGKRKRRKTAHGGKAGAGTGAPGSDDEDDDALEGVAPETAEAAAAGLSPEDRARFDFVRETFSASGGCYSSPCGGTMLTLAAALAAPQAAVRRMALQQLDFELAAASPAAAGADAPGADAPGLGDAQAALAAAALARLQDDDLGVVVAALGLACLRRLPPAALLGALQPLALRLGEHLYGSARLPQLKAARRAARKVAALLGCVGAASAACREAVALQLAALVLPSHRDPRVALEAARAAAGLGEPLFAGLAGALPALEALLQPAAAAAAPAEGKAKGGKGKAAPAADAAAAAPSKGSKKAEARAAAAAMERGVVAALAKALAADPAARLPDVMRLVAASAVAGAAADGGAGAASLRAQHLLLLAARAAAVGAKGKAASELARGSVQLAETLLPYARVAAAGDGDWLASFAEQVSPQDGLPTPAHAAALLADPVAAHGALILGVLRASLADLPEAAASTSSSAAAPGGGVELAAARSLGLLASLESPLERLRDLPLLVATRCVEPAARSAFLARLYSAPAGAGVPAAVQALALHVQGQLAASAGGGGRHAAAVEVGGWLVSVLAALAAEDAGVRAAACDCLAELLPLLQAGKATAGPALPAAAAAALCSGLLAQRAALCRDADAAHSLLRAALLGASASGGSAAAAATPPPTPSKSKKGAAASAASAAATASVPKGPLDLPTDAAAAVAAYLASCLHALAADAAGVNAACTALACLLPADSSPTTAAAAAAPELFAAGCAYLARLVARLQDEPASATPLHAHAAQQLLRLYWPAAAASAAAGGHEEQLGHIAEAAELVPPPAAAAPAPLPAAAVAALAATRLAAVAAVTPGLFGALPPACRTVRELFVVLLARSEGDSDEGVRAAARAALEAVPLSAELLLPLLDPHAPPPSAAAAAVAVAPPSKKKAKKADGAAATPGPAAADAPAGAAAAAAAPLPPAALRDAVIALELLQWRTGVLRPQLLVGALQALLLRLLPFVGSLADPMRADDEGGAGDDGEASDAADAAAAAAADEGGRSSLAGYAAMLALTALTVLARPAAAAAAAEEQRQLASAPFDVELAVRAAREAPDAAVRNAALGLLAALATRAPEAALSHVLQVLAVVNQSAALHDDEHSRAVAGAALAAVVPAWVAAGHRSTSPLWLQVVAALGSLPPQRRLDLLLALMRALPQAEEGLAEGLMVLLQYAVEPPPQPTPQPTPSPAPVPGTKASKSAKKARLSAAAADPAAAAAPAVLAGPPPSEWLPELASQLALQAELPVRLACCARVLEASLDASGRQPHTALPRTVVAFVVAQLKMKAAVAAASASLRRPDADPALEAACRRLMSAALASMQLLQPDSVASHEGSAAHAPSPAASPAAPAPSRHRAVLAATRGLYGMFAALQGVMAADAYLQALLTLAEHPSDKVKRRAIKLFTDKVRGVRAEVADHVELPQRVRDAKLRQASDAAARACAMLPPLLASGPPAGHAQGAGAGAGASPLTRQLALVALSAIAGEFGAAQHAALLAGVPAVLGATRDAHASIRASALATVAAFVRALGSKLVPVLPSTVAAAVAAADAAWARLSRTGGAGPAAAAKAPGPAAPTPLSGEESEEDDEGEEEDEEGDAGLGRRRLRAGADEEDAALELSSALACLNALVETLGGFLSPHLPSVLSILLNPRVLACRTSGCDAFAAAIRGRLPTVAPPRLLLPALYDRLQPCLDAAADAADAAAAAAPAAALLQMVASAVTAMEPKVAAQHHEQLFAFLLRALDVRQRQPPPLAAHGEAAIAAVEAAAVRALVALVMKLSEARFRPLFLRLLEWASTVSVPEGGGGGSEPSYLGRMAALFAAVNALSDRLRSVLVPYYRYLLEVIVQHLGDGLAGARARGKKKQRKSVAAAAAAAVEEDGEGETAALHQQRLSWLLRLRMVRALHRCFSHDSVGFTDAERFARLQPVLVEQLSIEPPPEVVPFLLAPHHADPDLDSCLALGAATRAYTAPDGAGACGPLGAAAVGCLLAMAVAANSDVLWKPLNHAALMLTRSGSARTRALALEVAAQLVERLREEYLVLLPETLPFLSELLEDGDAGVAARVRQVVGQLEEISGEKLDEYLKV